MSMKIIRLKVYTSMLFGLLAAALFATIVFAEEPTPGYNNPIPPKIMTPDNVKTRIGTLEFFDGLPSEETVEKVYENLNFIRGVEVFLNFIPATSIEGIRLGMEEIGATKSNQALIFDQLMDSNPLFLTGNTDTVYVSVILDLERDGATVIEIPPNTGPSTVNDAFFRFVTDMGIPGPDRGKGGIYVMLPPDYDGDINPPEGGMEAEMEIGGVMQKVFVSKSKSYTNWLIMRGFLIDGKPEGSTKIFKDGLKVYPLSKSTNPPAMEFISGSNKAFNTIHANNFEFYEELARVLQKEPIDFIDPELRGQAASIGIQKGKKFEPDKRMKDTLEEAVAVGNATARAILFQSREPDTYIYENSYWATPFIGGDYRWLKDKGDGGRYLDARTLFFYGATVNTPAMAMKIIGKGSQYAYNARDKNGDYLYGDKTYKLSIPANVPAKDFWSVVAYDPQTRSELQTGQKFPSKNNLRDKLMVNTDGSVDIYFSPEPPEGKESNWIETVPGKGWMVLIRLYGPLEPWFDKTWQPGEIELLD
jgi:hypothetical protein